MIDSANIRNHKFNVTIVEPWNYRQLFPNLSGVRPTKLILAYYGETEFTYKLLQELSKSSRAFCIQQEGLKKVLKKMPRYRGLLSKALRKSYMQP